MEFEFINGSIESPSNPNDYTFDNLYMGELKEPPNSYKLDWIYNILNQGNIGSCKAHALKRIKDYIDNGNYSIGWIYGNRSNSDWQGAGLISRETLKHCVDDGFCENELFNYNIEYPSIADKIDKIGKDKLMNNANKHKSLAYIRLGNDNIKSYLFNYQKPILIDVKVYSNFYQANTNGGYIPKFAEGNKLGGHSMIIIGYDNDNLIIVNSWGGNRGDKGIFYLDINSPIIKELWALEDELNVNRPKKSGWEEIKPTKPSEITRWKYIKDGNYLKDCWLGLNNNWFRFKDEYAISNDWFKDSNGDWYYFDNNCYMKTGWVYWKGDYYYMNTNHDGYYGKMLTNQWVDNGKYYVDENGVWVK